MPQVIKHIRSAVAGKVPTTSELALGVLAVNTYDGKVFLKKDNGAESIVEVGAGAAASPVLQPAYLISEDVTLGTNRHGLSLTSVEVGSGYSVTVPEGATWTIAVL